MFNNIFIIGFVLIASFWYSFGDEYVGDYNKNYNEFEAVIERPCPSFDLYCIRQYFAKHSDCIIAVGPVPNPDYYAQGNVYAPTFNISLTLRNVFFTNTDAAVVSEFYVNKVTDLVVLAVDYRNIGDNLTAVVRFHRSGQEPAITNTRTIEFYPSFTITTVFRGIDHIRLEDSESHIFMDAIPTLVIDPSVVENPDPNVPRTFAELLALVDVYTQEAFLTASPFIAGRYIQYNICDFGLKLF